MNFETNKKKMIDGQLNDDGYTSCQFWGITTKQIDCHHIVFRSEKPRHEKLHSLENLILVCYDCHNRLHKNKLLRSDLVKQRGLHKIFGIDVLLNRNL